MRDLSNLENVALNQNICPVCLAFSGSQFLKGPEGGLSTNIKCKDCGSTFNHHGGIFVAQLLYDAIRPNPQTEDGELK